MDAVQARRGEGPLRRQVVLWMAAILLITLAAIGMATGVGQWTLTSFDALLEDNSACYTVQNAIKAETRAFERYVREPSQENQQDYNAACAATEQSLAELPFDYATLGEERYARTWNLLQGYAGYQESRDAFLQMSSTEDGYVDEMYRVMNMQDYLAEYALRLTQAALEQENARYQARARLLNRLPWFYGALVLAVALLTLLLRRAMKVHLATQNALHQEEVRNLALEKDLDHTRLEVLKSQVNPHFLFNTLNMISCMARLEDAATTDEMIVRLGSLFRHNLRTKQQEITLEEELEGVDDYIYLQQMRFDGRITVEKQIEVEPSAVRLPSFTLQPVIENAFAHGLKACEEGGRILLHVWQEGDTLLLTVADNGKGMTEAELAALQEKIRQSEQTGRGIGLGNISRRISLLYPGGAMQIESRPGQGTVVRFRIPQRKEEHA